MGRRIKAASMFRRSSFRKVSAVFLLVSIGATAIMLARSKPGGDHVRTNDLDGKVLRIDTFYPIGSLEPKPENSGANEILHFLYSYLFIMNEDGQLEPDLASRWRYDEKSFSWTIQIREGAQFHDGSPVTALDVVYSLKIGIETVLRSALLLCDRITTISDETIVIYLKKDDPSFLQRIWSLEILKRPTTNDINDAIHPNGSGPFKFEYRIGNVEVGLRANEHYYRGRPAIDRVVFYYQPDKERSWARLLSGKTDLVRSIEAQDYRIIEHYRDRFHFRTTVEPFIIMLIYNTQDICLRDPRVRIALSSAIDKEFIVRVIMKGMGVVPRGNVGYYSSLGDPGFKPIPCDPSKSIRLLREAGWAYDSRGLYLQKDGKPFDLTILLLQGNRLHGLIARYIQLCLHDLGIKVHIQPLPFYEFEKRYWSKAEFQAVLTELSDFLDPNRAMDAMPYLTRKQAGWSRFANPRVTAIIDQVSQEAARSRRKALFHELDSLLDSSQPATLLAQKASLDVLSKRFMQPCGLSDLYYLFKLWQVSPASR